MSDTPPIPNPGIDPLIVDAIRESQSAVLQPEIVRAMGAGKAYQMIAQSCAIAIQDAADNLRNVSTISTTAIGVAMANLMETGDPRYLGVVEQAQQLVVAATQNFTAIGDAAGKVLGQFPTG